MCKKVGCATVLASVFLIVAILTAVAAIILDTLTINEGGQEAICGYKELRYPGSDVYDRQYYYEDLCDEDRDNEELTEKYCDAETTGLIVYYATIGGCVFVLVNLILILCHWKRTGSVLGLIATLIFACAIASWLGTDEDFDNEGNRLCWRWTSYSNDDIEVGWSLLLTGIATICAFIGALLSCVRGQKVDDDDYQMTTQHSNHGSNYVGQYNAHV